MENGRPAAYITGVGVVSPVGIGRKRFWSSLLANESGARPITLFDPDGFEVRIAAECTEFDANDASDTPFTFRLGHGDVIRGWDEGVAGMRVGGVRQLVIPPELGYGAGGRNAIPGNAILVFTVTVVAAE